MHKQTEHHVKTNRIYKYVRLHVCECWIFWFALLPWLENVDPKLLKQVTDNILQKLLVTA